MEVATSLKSLRSNDIAYAISCEHERSGKLLLRVSSDIAADHGQAHAEAQALEVAQPKRDEATPLVAFWETDKHCCTSDADHVCDNHRWTACVGPFAANEATSEESCELYETTRNLEVLSAQGVEAELSDDQRSEL